MKTIVSFIKNRSALQLCSFGLVFTMALLNLQVKFNLNSEYSSLSMVELTAQAASADTETYKSEWCQKSLSYAGCGSGNGTICYSTKNCPN